MTVKSDFALSPGAGDLPKLTLVAPDGARAEVYLHGAHVTSWVPAGGQERLFLSRAAQFRAGTPIRGGVPVVFPQFGKLGPLPQHGFARVSAWELAGADGSAEGATATLRLRDTEDTRRIWPHAFLAELGVRIGASQLAVSLAIANTDAEPYSFTAALHTYLSVADLAATRVEGLAGLRYRDSAAGGVEAQQDAGQVDFPGEVDRIYFAAPAELRLVEPGRTTVIRKEGFWGVVVWNPGAARSASMPDLEPDDYRRFVCVEAAAIEPPVSLAPGERWQGTQTLLV